MTVCIIFLMMCNYLILFIRYLSEHGYNIATDSGNIVDTQRIIKRLLDVCIPC